MFERLLKHNEISFNVFKKLVFHIFTVLGPNGFHFQMDKLLMEQISIFHYHLDAHILDLINFVFSQITLSKKSSHFSLEVFVDIFLLNIQVLINLAIPKSIWNLRAMAKSIDLTSFNCACTEKKSRIILNHKHP